MKIPDGYVGTDEIQEMIRGRRPNMAPTAHDIWGTAAYIGVTDVVSFRKNKHTPLVEAERIVAEYIRCWDGPFESDGKIWYNNFQASEWLRGQTDDPTFRDDTVWKKLQKVRIERKRINGRYHVTHESLERYMKWYNKVSEMDPGDRKIPNHINYDFNNADRARPTRTPEENRRIIADMERRAMRGELKATYIPHKTAGKRPKRGDRGAGTLDRSLFSDEDAKAWL